MANHLPLSAQSGNSDTPSMYGVLNDGKITLYYDRKKANRSGTIFDKNWQEWNSEGRKMMDNYREEITECVIDPSCANWRPTNLNSFFEGWKNLKSIKGMEYLNTENVTYMARMFENCSSLTSLDVSGFNTEKVTDMCAMFAGCSSLTSLDVSGFKTENVTNMAWMFAYCSNLTSLDVSGFNTEKVTDMYGIFLKCSNLTSLDVSGFNTEKVTKMGLMFYGCSNLTTIYASDLWDMSNVTDSELMFNRCFNLVGGAGTTYDKDHRDGEYARIDGGTSNPGYFTYKEYSGIATPLSIGEKPLGVYNLGCAKVRRAKQGTDGLPSGLYIIDKKKVLVK